MHSNMLLGEGVYSYKEAAPFEEKNQSIWCQKVKNWDLVI